MLSGCTMLETTAPAANQPTALSWLTNWVSQPMELAPGFDVEAIKPDPRPTAVVAENLLEITVWDLYEPGKPYSFPVRVSSRSTIEVPLLGEFPVEGRTIADVETALAERFRTGEYLLNPRVLVRSLDSPIVKIQVMGAVNRAGFVELTRTDPSVYAAILSAGSLKKTAGTQVSVTRRSLAAAVDMVKEAGRSSTAPMGDEADEASLRESRPPALHVNSVDEIAVAPAGPEIRPSRASGASSTIAAAYTPGGGPPRPVAPQRGANAEVSTTWYDLSQTRDFEELKQLQLADGDTVTVKSATPPLRIGGVVNHPGTYPLPPGKTLNVWQAIDLAGGIRDDGVPLNITLLRAAGEGRPAKRWYLNVPAYGKHPDNAPFVEHGDVLHVEPTTGSKIKRVVGDLWKN